MTDWPTPCELVFDELADNDPDRLVEWITTGHLGPTVLTFALEALGRTGHPASESILVAMLDRESSIVREGALLGMQSLQHVSALTVETVRVRANSDCSKAVRTVACETLDAFRELT